MVFEIVENQSPLYAIVAKFPKVLEYRTRIEAGDIVNNFLLIVGGSVTERDACIDYISGLSAKKSNRSMRSGNDCVTLQKLVLNTTINNENLFDPIFLETNRNEPSNIRRDGNKLFVLPGIAKLDRNVLTDLAERLDKSQCKQNFLIATMANNTDLSMLPETCKQMFDEIDITMPKEKEKKRNINYASKEDVDDILRKYVEKNPEKGRQFIVNEALPELKKEFSEDCLYKKSTLMTRISIIRKSIATKLCIDQVQNSVLFYVDSHFSQPELSLHH